MLQHHRVVRVKLASDQIAAEEVANTFCSNALLVNAELLQIKHKGIMFGIKAKSDC